MKYILRFYDDRNGDFIAERGTGAYRPKEGDRISIPSGEEMFRGIVVDVDRVELDFSRNLDRIKLEVSLTGDWD